MADRVPVKIFAGRAVVQFAAPGEIDRVSEVFSQNNVQHLRTTVEEPINSWKTVTHVFQAKHRDYVGDLLQPYMRSFGVNPPLVMVRFGLVAGDETAWRPWEEHVLLGARPRFLADQQSGPLVTIKTSDRLALMHASKRVRVHTGRVSDVVGAMFRGTGAQNLIVEDTSLGGHETTTGTWYQANESDWSFLTRVMLPAARNSRGISGYRVFVRDNIWRFHSPGYGVPEIKQLPYSKGAPGFDLLAVEDRSIELSIGGGASGVRRLIYDPTTGESRMVEPDYEKLVKFASERPTYRDYEYFYSHVGLNREVVEEIRTQQYFTALSSEAYRLEITSVKCMELRVGDVFEALLTTEEESTLYSGLWLINKAVHTLNEGTLSSVFSATRGETALSEKTVDLDAQVSDGVPFEQAHPVEASLEVQLTAGGEFTLIKPIVLES